MAKQLKIGILGTRGIPNRYGGFEQCAEYLALGLTNKGHHVYVYNAHNHEFRESIWKGVNIIHCYDPEQKLGTFGQFIYDYNCIKDARTRKFDILLQLGYTSNSIWYKRWPRDAKNVVNMDGLEWKRTKYNKYVQRFLRYAERLAALNADMLVADSIGIKDYLKNKYNKDATFIPYGAEVFPSPDPSIISKYGLVPDGYFLVLARMEPENNIDMIIKSVVLSKQDKQIIVIGKTDNNYGHFLTGKYKTNERVKFLGGIYDQPVVNNLRYFSSLYFHGHTVGGTNPSLLEAMGCSALIAAHDNIFNKSILGHDAFYFQNADQLALVINTFGDKHRHQEKISNNLAKIKTHYSWASVTEQYESAFFHAMIK